MDQHPSSQSLRHWLDGRLDESDSQLIEDHLANCTDICPAILETISNNAELKLTESTAGGPERCVAESGSVISANSTTPQKKFGDYRAIRQVGRGGMGVVFEAEDDRTQRRVAIKVMAADRANDPQAKARFLREARAAAKIDHENVVPLYHVGEENGVPFIVMPLLQGETLETRLKREGRLPPAEVIRIGREISAGLAAAHVRGLVHRDIKPANIWLDVDTGRARILDFGLARAVDGSDGMTNPGALVGTPAYMAPEEVDGQPPDARSDLFSLGATLYICATGQPAFTGPTLPALLRAVTDSHPPPPHQLNPAVPIPLSSLIMRLLEKKPHRRPLSASEVAEEGEKLVAHQFDGVHRGSKNPTRWLWLAAAGVLVVAVVGLWATGVFRVRTSSGILVIKVNEPDADVFVDGEKAIVTWGADGKTATISIKPGTRKVEVRKEGFTVHGEEVTLEDGGRRILTARLEPEPRPTEVKGRATAAEPVRDFVVCHGLESKQFDDWLSNEARNFNMRWLDVRKMGTKTFFSAVAVKNTQKEVIELRHRVPDEDHKAITQDWNQMLPRGFRPVWDWRYQDNSSWQRTRLWQKDGVLFYLWDTSADSIRGVTNPELRQGRLITSITPHLQEDRLNCLVIIEFTIRECEYSLDFTRDKLADYAREIEKKGWGLDQITAYEIAGKEQFVVIASKNDGKPARTVEFDIPKGNLKGRIEEQRKKGFMPWCLTAYGSVSSLNYVVIWSPFEVEKR